MNTIDWKDFGFPNMILDMMKNILQYVWNTYCGFGTPIIKLLDLYRVYKYIHMDFTRRQHFNLSCSKWYLHYNVINCNLSYLSTHLNEIHWSDRLSPWNHAKYFPRYVTAMTETTPVYVQQPKFCLFVCFYCYPSAGFHNGNTHISG